MGGFAEGGRDGLGWEGLCGLCRPLRVLIAAPSSPPPPPLLCRSGTVVRCGPGKMGDDGQRTAPKVAPGDRVIFFKYAGDAMETPSGDKYNVMHEQDIRAKM